MAVVEGDDRRRTLQSSGHVGDTVFGGLTFLFAIVVILAGAALILTLIVQAWPALRGVGGSVFGQTWNPNNGVFGAMSIIYGTVVTALIALLLAGVIGVMIAVFLTELAPPMLARPVSFLVEMLAAVPSIIFGLWGIFVLKPLLNPVQTWLSAHLGFIPFFSGTPSPNGSIFIASIVLAIMILPTIAAISRDVMAAVPGSQREGMLALGATRWETVRHVVIPYARSGIIGALVLGLGRAIGETMAVTMVIGNSAHITGSLFSAGYSIAAALAIEANQAFENPLWIGTLFELGLILLMISVLLNGLARLLVWRVNRAGGAVTVRG